MERLKGKVAIITGGNSGVGAATAKLFASEGAAVVITARREAALEAVANEITEAGGTVLAVSTDISKPGDAEKLITITEEKFGKIDILVNNANAVFAAPGHCDFGKIYRVYDISVLDIIDKLLSRHSRAVVLGFGGGSSQMRDSDNAVNAQNIIGREVGYISRNLA